MGPHVFWSSDPNGQVYVQVIFGDDSITGEDYVNNKRPD